MLNNVGALRHPLVRAAVAAIAALCFNASLSAGPAVKEAAMLPDDPGRTIAPANAHQSFIHIPDTPGVTVRKNIKIGLGKSVLLEFPRDVRDVMVSNPAAVDAVVLVLI